MLDPRPSPNRVGEHAIRTQRAIASSVVFGWFRSSLRAPSKKLEDMMSSVDEKVAHLSMDLETNR